MHLREDQIELLEQIESGLVWEWHIDPVIDSRLLCLRELGLIQAREDLRENLLCLTESGKTALDLVRQKRLEREEQNHRDEAAQTVKLQERREDMEAAEKRLQAQSKAAEELQKLRQDFDKYRTEEASYHAAEALREKRAEKRGFRKGILTAVIAGVIVAIFSYCLPGIVSFIVHIISSVSS